MLCQSCEKNNATIHFTKIVNNHVVEKHLCESCAKENNEFNFELPFSIHKLFTGLISPSAEEQQDIKDLTCPKCKLTYKNLMDIGKFGCGECYKTFRDDIKPLLRGIHGHIEHKGKTSKDYKNIILQKKKIEDLRLELQVSIENEDFERAALLRDEIKRLSIEIGKVER